MTFPKYCDRPRHKVNASIQYNSNDATFTEPAKSVSFVLQPVHGPMRRTHLSQTNYNYVNG